MAGIAPADSISSMVTTVSAPDCECWANNDKLESLAQAVLDARAAFPEATLADLYDPDLMPPTLRHAHRALDRAVDRLYRSRGFASEHERAEHLFMLYEKMRVPLGIGVKKRKRRRR